ncbi:SPOR domain-containing protein [Hydrogenophaga sp. OTU3427]|uniref:SPOR domain-containing protein n=1 Tax=Hydrogenophaga sp. OTU3427 TaxID=3043856 RepID=UPI00313D4E42
MPTATVSESPTTALYRAALGPLNTDHHLRAFADFDDTGVAGPRWNGAAALLTLNWLVYRRLWRLAGAYVLVLVGACALLWALGWGRWPPGVWAGLLGTVVVLASVVPGLWAEAWLHGQVRQAMIAAVRDAPSLPDACEALRRRAPSMARFGALALLNFLLGAAAFSLHAGWPTGPQGAAPPSAVAAASTPAMSEPAPAVLPVKLAESSAPNPPPTAAVVPPPVRAPERMAVSAPQPLSVPAPAEAVQVPPAPGAYAVNVGLFADAGNAERLHARLNAAGLPAYLQTLETAQGTRTRVRVGPMASRAQADRMAERIRSMGLEARVFKAD